MLEYDRIDISEGIDINKANASKECDICHYSYFLDKKLQLCKYVSKYISPSQINLIFTTYTNINSLKLKVVVKSSP